MLAFRPVTIDSKGVMEPYLRRYNYRCCELSFTSIFIWSGKSRIEFAEYGGFLILRTFWDGRESFLFPMGDGDLLNAVETMEKDVLARGGAFRMAAVSSKMLERLNAAAPGQFTATETRNWADYLYRASDLIDLPGKKYHSKRNFIKRFITQSEGRYAYHDMTPDMIRDVRDFLELWSRNDEAGIGEAENDAVDRALSNMEALSMKGGLLTVDGRIVAFTAGTKISDDTWDISIEKADYGFMGSYPMINNCFAKANCAHEDYINREDDVGIEGLRKSKLSYHPCEIIAKYLVKRAGE